MDLDKFIMQDSVNGTIFHTSKFLSYHFYKFKDVLFGVKGIYCTMAEQDGMLVSHPGSSYGGPVFAPSVRYSDLYSFISMLVRDSKKNGLAGIRMRLAPKVFWREQRDDLDFALLQHGFSSEEELSSAIYLPTHKGSMDFSSSARGSYVKGVRAGLTSREIGGRDSDQMARFYLLLKQNLKKHDVTPTHTLIELIALREMLPEYFRFHQVFFEGKIIAGSMVVVCNDQGVHTFYLCQDYDYQKLRPMNYLMYSLIKTYQGYGYKYLNLGISTEDSGKTLNGGLLRFKEGFGAKGVIRRTYTLKY